MEAATQRVLCCIGQSVAGYPTQFLMQRLFAVHGLDWTAISVEVASEDLQAAIAGCRAMHFAALRLYPPYVESSSQLFPPAPQTPYLRSGFTSAAPENGQWIAWHHAGFGMLQLLRNYLDDLQRALFWLHGQSDLVLSVLEILCQQQKQVVWSYSESKKVGEGPPSIPERGLTAISINDAIDRVKHHLRDENAPREDLVVVSDEPIAMYEGTWNMFLDALESRPSGVEPSLRDAPRDITASSEQDPPRRFITLEGVLAFPLSTLPAPWSAEILTRRDLAVACEAYDFERWTGIVPNTELLRDAYDEFFDL